jgi:hypothetical protein
VRRRRPLLIAAALVLGALVWLVVSTGLDRASERVQVWSLATPVVRGQVVDRVHLAPVEIAAPETTGVLVVTNARLGELLGGVWAADLPAGTLVSHGLILERLEVAADEALVGLALSPGRWPSPALRAGDVVMVVRTGDQPGVLVERATVDGIAVLGDAVSATRLVTVTVPRGSVSEVAAAAAAGNVTLVVVS